MLKPLEYLREVILGQLELEGKDMDAIIYLNPRSIDLSYNPITDKGLLKLTELSDLKWLSIKFCQNTTPAGLAPLKAKFPYAEYIGKEFDVPDGAEDFFSQGSDL